MCIIGKTHEAPQQVFRLLFYSLSYFIGNAGFLLSKVLASRKKNLSNARARKNKYTARMLADARKDHFIPLRLLSGCDWVIRCDVVYRTTPEQSDSIKAFLGSTKTGTI